jgi:hypothetical protein
MNGQLITFTEIQQRQEVDLIGSQIELDTGDGTCRGTISDIFWWNHYPRKFNWVHEMTWSIHHRGWVELPQKMKSFSFEFKSIEFFSGPFELDTGEIFFLYNDTSAITIYPHGCIPPDNLQSGELYRLLRSHLQVTRPV